MYGNMYNLMISCISYEVRYEEYHHQKLALESRSFCYTLAYLATLLHSNNTKDVKELMVSDGIQGVRTGLREPVLGMSG